MALPARAQASDGDIAAHQALTSAGAEMTAGLRALPPARKAVSPYALLTLDHRQVKWGAPRPGAGAVVRYAFVTGAVDRPEGVNCTAMGPIEGSLRHSPLDTARFALEVRRAMAAWEAAADIRFEPAVDPARADLVIGMQRRPHGIAFADVVLARRGGDGMGSIGQAAICFNPELAWEDGFDGNDRTPDVRYVAGHEIGHILGLDHAWGPDKLMNFKYREALRTPQRADLAGAVFLYGTTRSAPAAPPVTAVLIPVSHGGGDAAGTQ